MSKLKILATPIGNIRDITLRALDELKQADLILAEDTRHSGQLLHALGVTLKASARMISCDARKEKMRVEIVLESLTKNQSVILISDAGCPGISDPGSLLVQAIVQAGFLVEVLPGASALTASLMGAGIDCTRFSFLTFLPQKNSLRQKLILDSAKAELALIIYESPTRVESLLDELFELLGPRRVVVARELTKLFESFHRGVLGSPLQPQLISKGECVVLVERGKAQILAERCRSDEQIEEFIKENIKNNSAKDISHALAHKFSMKKKDALKLVLAHLREEK